MQLVIFEWFTQRPDAFEKPRTKLLTDWCIDKEEEFKFQPACRWSAGLSFLNFGSSSERW